MTNSKAIRILNKYLETHDDCVLYKLYDYCKHEIMVEEWALKEDPSYIRPHRDEATFKEITIKDLIKLLQSGVSVNGGIATNIPQEDLNEEYLISYIIRKIQLDRPCFVTLVPIFIEESSRELNKWLEDHAEEKKKRKEKFERMFMQFNGIVNPNIYNITTHVNNASWVKERK